MLSHINSIIDLELVAVVFILQNGNGHLVFQKENLGFLHIAYFLFFALHGKDLSASEIEDLISSVLVHVSLEFVSELDHVQNTILSRFEQVD